MYVWGGIEGRGGGGGLRLNFFHVFILIVRLGAMPF